MDADVLIIGAGPSGSVAAKLLHQRGHRVVILEKEQFPRFSIGESLLPHCMEFLEEADMLDAVMGEGFQHKNGAAFSLGGKLTDFDFAQQFTQGWQYTYQVQRGRFDQILADNAASVGVPIHYQQRIVDVDFSQAGQAIVNTVDADDQQHIWHAKIVLDASGFGRVLPRLLDLETPSSLAPRQAYATHIEDNITTTNYDRNKVLIAIHPEQHEVWFWLIPFSNGRASFGVVAPAGFLEQRGNDPATVLRQLALEEPRLAELLQNSVFDTPINRIGGYSANVKQLFGPGFVLLGNAGEFLDPVFSSGITIALKSASLAVPLVDKHLRGLPVDWSTDYEQALRKGIQVFRAYVDAWYDGRFQQIIFQDNQLPNIRAMICSILAGFAWDETNPMTQRSVKKIDAIVETCMPI